MQTAMCILKAKMCIKIIHIFKNICKNVLY